MTNAYDPLAQAARQLAERLGCESGSSLRHVRLRQVGEMREGAASAWMKFRARQCIELDAPAFEWKARTAPFGAICVNDRFSNGSGCLAVRLFGLFKIAGAARSVSLDRGELMRYLAELAWAPDAILRNRTLHWRELDELRLAVCAGEGERRAEIEITLDQEGRIGEVFAADRPRAIGDHFQPSPWRGTYSDYRRVEGRLVPMPAQVGWLKESAYEAVWRGSVTEWKIV